jgi:hypothetical protein
MIVSEGGIGFTYTFDYIGFPGRHSLNELLGGRAGTAYNYILPNHLICLKGLVDLNGRILELLNQFRAHWSEKWNIQNFDP